MTAPFRSAFFGSSGFVAVRPQARVIADVPAGEAVSRRDRHVATRDRIAPACRAKAA